MAADGKIDVLLYGLGAIGSFYAFILSRNPNVQLTVVARSNYDAVKNTGLIVNSQNHGQHTVHPYRVVKTPAEANQKFDYVVCAHKAIDQGSAVTALGPAVDEDRTTIVIIQNGVGNEEPFRNAWPKVTIITCVTWTGATQTSPGYVEHTKSEDMQIGLFPSTISPSETEKTRLDTLSSLLTRGGTKFTVLDDMPRQRWEKVVWNAAWNSLTTVTLLDTQTWLKSGPEAMPVTRKLMTEVIEVGRACGVTSLDYNLVDRLIERILAMPPIGSSMQTDCKAGRPLEVDVILGYPYRKSKELGLNTPTLDTIYAVVVGVDRRLRDALGK
ncbi:putative ketopantoate reductase family protein [Talaromyces proteolyticus]|uniref:2-dehydropantoate 2-reductase n=1 Tax=Talaromyces proteolyticus TaxID=1131652 RepID=A0AAD4KKZ2_9EURO|nr:putative ketopantoate reductase family protein [Talaromyces proteolyticus]KAH8690586.1 putative ketopantoate reductase family protein [Talaromyces proteolyticus]